MQGEYIWNTSRGAFTAFKLVYNSGDKGTSISEISKKLKANRSVVSRQLMVLEKKGVVKVKMRGKTKIWFLNMPKIKKLLVLKNETLNENLMNVMIKAGITFENFIKFYKAMNIILKKYKQGEY